MNAAGEKHLAFMPAMPVLHRITVGGVHYIDGAPVAESVFGKDPFEPVRESDVAKLIGLQTGIAAVSVTWEHIPADRDGIRNALIYYGLI